MANRLHTNAMNYPLPLVRDNSMIEPSRLYGGWVLSTDFGPELGRRVVFFGSDRDDLLRRLGDAGSVEVYDKGVWRVV